MSSLFRRPPVRAGGAEHAFRFSPRTLGVTIGLFAVGYLILAFNVPDYSAVEVPVQPNTLPRWLGLTLLILAVMLFFQHDPRTEETPDEADEQPGEQPGERLGRFDDVRVEVLVLLGSLAAYVLLFEPLGFILATAAYLAGSIWYLGYRRPLVVALIAIGVPFVLYASMTWGLGVVLPRGPLPF